MYYLIEENLPIFQPITVKLFNTPALQELMDKLNELMFFADTTYGHIVFDIENLEELEETVRVFGDMPDFKVPYELYEDLDRRLNVFQK